LLKSLGSDKVKIVPRNLDKGVDILADFSLAHTFKFTLGVQAKHYQPEPPVGPQEIDQLASGMEAEGVSFGWFVTSGTFSKEASDRKAEIEEKQGVKMELIDGEQLAALIIEAGLHKIVVLNQT
jgi:restriction endonuclease Mrr